MFLTPIAHMKSTYHDPSIHYQFPPDLLHCSEIIVLLLGATVSNKVWTRPFDEELKRQKCANSRLSRPSRDKITYVT